MTRDGFPGKESSQWADSTVALNKYAELVSEITLWQSCLVASNGNTFTLTGAEVSVGRKSRSRKWFPTLDLSAEPNGLTVSRRHAILFRRGVLWYVYEVPEGTVNGTYLNGQQTRPGESYVLRDGDLLRFGGVEFVFRRGP